MREKQIKKGKMLFVFFNIRTGENNNCQQRNPMWTPSHPRRRGEYDELEVKCFKCGKFGHFAKEYRSKIDHTYVIQEKCKNSHIGDTKDDNLSVGMKNV